MPCDDCGESVRVFGLDRCDMSFTPLILAVYENKTYVLQKGYVYSCLKLKNIE